MQLVLERCTVCPWRLDDAESLAKRANNRKIWLEVRDLFPHPYTIQDAHEFLQRVTFEGRLKYDILKDGKLPALRPDNVASCEPATCVSVDHRRYDPP